MWKACHTAATLSAGELYILKPACQARQTGQADAYATEDDPNNTVLVSCISFDMDDLGYATHVCMLVPTLFMLTVDLLRQKGQSISCPSALSFFRGVTHAGLGASSMTGPRSSLGGSVLILHRCISVAFSQQMAVLSNWDDLLILNQRWLHYLEWCWASLRDCGIC